MGQLGTYCVVYQWQSSYAQYVSRARHSGRAGERSRRIHACPARLPPLLCDKFVCPRQNFRHMQTFSVHSRALRYMSLDTVGRQRTTTTKIQNEVVNYACCHELIILRECMPARFIFRFQLIVPPGGMLRQGRVCSVSLEIHSYISLKTKNSVLVLQLMEMMSTRGLQEGTRRKYF